MTDDEKYFHKGEATIEEYQRYGRENAKDILAVGFNPEKTFLFLDTEYIGNFYKNVCIFQKHLTYNQVYSIFLLLLNKLKN